ncbi:hypothetical protein PENTCL1PPCAC_17258, partial [Pristionchus entomophagus]
HLLIVSILSRFGNRFSSVMDHQHLLQSLWRRQHSLMGSTGSSFGSTESSIDSTTSAYSSASAATTNTQLPILQEEDPCAMELSPGAGTSSPNGTPSPPFNIFSNTLLNTNPGMSSSPLLHSDSSSTPMITPPPSYQAALLNTFKMPDLDKLNELAALLNATSAAASILSAVSLIPPPLPTTQPPRDDLMPLDLSTKSSSLHPSALLAPAHLLQHSSGCSSVASTAAAAASVVRPSVILDGTNLRRSSSSITASSRPVPDVNEHFRRSLSGKWPRRVSSIEERRPVAPFRRPPSGQSAASRSSPAPSCNNNNTIVITTNSNETIEDYFRRALGVEEFEEWKRSREEIEDRRRRQREEHRF